MLPASTLPCANYSWIDYSSDHHDTTCCPATLKQEWELTIIWIWCKYSDEKYLDNWPFNDTLHSRAFPYIETLRINCIQRWRWDKKQYPYPAYNIPRKYYPNDPVTRAEVMKTYVKLLWIHDDVVTVTREEDPYPGNTPFADVPKTNWASWYADTAYKKWILVWFYTKRKGKLYLSPNTLTTRQELITMMMKTYRLIYPKTLSSNFTTQFVDVKKSNPYYQYIIWAEQLWFIQWYTRNGKKYFDWAAYTTRAQFAKLVALPFKEQLSIDINTTILNSKIYKQIISILDTIKSDKRAFINELIGRASLSNAISFTTTFHIDKQVFLDSLRTLLLEYESNK